MLVQLRRYTGLVIGASGESRSAPISDTKRTSRSYDERVKRAAQRLRELQASGVALSEILSGEEGAVFVHEDCEGDPEVAAAAFALVHSRRTGKYLGPMIRGRAGV